LVCSGGADTNPSDGLTLTVDENVICTFTNTFVPKPNIEAVKTIANTLPNPVQVNDIISYTIVVSNTGNVPLSNISFNDTLTDGDGNTYSLSSAQAVIDSGVISNTVTAIGTPPLGPNVSDISDNGDDTDGNTSDDPTVQTLSPQSGLLLDKAATPNPNTLILGDTITYTFVATNTGNVTLDSVTITDGMSGLSSLSCDQTIPANDFAPNEVLTCTATYVVTQADVDAGSIVNNATVSGTAPDGSSTNDSDDETVSGVPNPQIEAVKTVANTLSNPVQAGDVITYTITVDNIGNQSLSNITLDDTLTDGSGNVLTITGPTYVSGDTNIDNNLAVTETWTYAASFALTQSVIDSGGITNTVTVTGTSPSGTDVSDVSDDGDDSDGNTSDDPTEQVLTSQPRLALDKMATLNPSNLVLGDTIAYTFVAINTGNVTLDNVDINDPMSGLSALSCTLATAVGGAGEIALQNFDSTTYLPFLSTSAGTNIHSAATADSDIVKGASAVVAVTLPYDNFLPGETLTCTATYIVTQNDVNIGSIVNNATVNGTAPDGSSINDSDGETVPGVPNPQIEALKIVANTLPSLVQAGDVITYTITVDNTGNQTLSNITLDDTLTDGNGNALIITGPTYVSGDTNIDSNLAVTETWTYVASFALTQDVIDSGGITNTVTVTGTSPSGTDVSDISDDGDDTDGNTSDDPTGLTLGPKPKIQLTKSVGVVTDANSNVTTDAGDTIAYTFTLLNSGNVTLSPLSIVDNKVANISCLANSLAPGVSTTCTGDPYLILQADVNVGGVENSATAFGTPPAGPPVSDVSDSGEGTEEIETDDLNGQIDGDPTNDPTVTLIQPQPVLELIKVGVLDDGGNGRADPGDVINYRFTISNTGSVDISNITISDPILDTVNGGPIALLPAYGSDSTTFSGSLTLTSSIIASGGITNTATATGTAPDGSSVSDISDDPTEMSNTDINGNGNGDDPTFVPLMPQPAISLEKVGNWIDADNNGTAEVGETVSYSFGVRNSGNVNLTNVTITDPLVSVSGGPIPTLAVGALDSTTFTAVYTLTSADIAAGAIINQATATGNDPSGNPVRDDSDDPTDATDIDPDGDGDPDDPTVTPLVPQPRITLTKEATFNDEDGDGLTEVDETISYAFTVWNTGNIDLFNVTIDDPLITVSGGPISTLPIGTIDNTTFNGLYTITERDIVAGEVINQATANGNSADDGSGTNVTDLSDDPSDLTNQDIDGDGDPDDPTVLPLTMLPRMSLIKAGTFNDEDGDGNAQPGETISYSFTVVNTGNVELTNITITDPIVSVSGGPLASLGIGASDSTTFSAVYKLTSADIAAKEVINQAIATGDDPRGNPVSDDSDDPNDLTNIDPDNDGEPDDPTIVQLTPVPDISLLKTSVFNDENGDGYAQVDETISYSFVVLNTGNVDLSNITISDPLVTLSGGPIPFLAVGDSDSNTFSGTYTLQISDLASDAITNTATVNATDPDGFPVRDVSDDPRDMTNIDPDGDGDPDDETVAPFVPSGYLVSFFWIDEDGDGLKESGEPPLVGATVILYDSTGNEVARTITDEAGLFIFTVPPNEYEMEFISPSGFVFSPMGDENIPFRNAADQNGRLALSLDGGENELEVGGGIVSAPTAVELNEFSIALRETKEGDEIVIRWETALELDTAGFHILRSSDGIQTSARRMTTHLIPSQDITGGSYEVILPQIDQFVFLPFLNQ